MKKNLNSKIALIAAVLLVCVYGIVGIPSGFTGKALLASITDRIHLGLDLRGGAHLILEVKVLEAVGDETDSAVGRINQALKGASFAGSASKPDPVTPQVVRVSGITAAQASWARSLLDDKFSNQYDLTGGNGDGTITLTMKPTAVTDLEAKTVQQTIETITDRVDSLGVTEPVVAPYGLGANQILVELPGIDDLDQVKTLLTSTARLEIHAVVGGPYKDDQEAAGSVGGNVPPDQMTVHGSSNVSSSSLTKSFCRMLSAWAVSCSCSA